MDIAFISGMAAFLSAIAIFVGSAFLLLTLILGARLAYFITASITLAFLLIMGVVWSINPLGPVGELASWGEVDTATSAEEIEGFGAASSYPEGDWRAPDEDDDAEKTQVSELETSGTEAIVAAAGEGELEGWPQNPSGPLVVEDSSRLTEVDGVLYGATTVEVENEGETVEAVAVMKYDPGNPLGQARMLTIGTLILFVLHLFGLSRAERRGRERGEVQTA
jgi:hypothetical protein